MTQESREDTGEIYPLGSATEYALEQSLYALSTAAILHARGEAKEGYDYKTCMAASTELLLRLEQEHGLPRINEYRRRFRNVMREKRMFASDR